MSDVLPSTDEFELPPAAKDDPAPTPTVTVGTDFLTYAVGGGANVEAQADYQADPQRTTGALPGVARSNFTNKAVRQGTFIAHSLSLWIAQQLAIYVPDDGNDVNWIAEWTQALTSYIGTVIPPAPNLGNYLPLTGGTMTGNILFSTGISTILNNNTWYFARDTGGQARGLILKGSDNNVYINDGSSTYIYHNGIPVANNNVSWAGKDTGGTSRSLIGILTDNAVHIGGGTANNIYLDCGAGGGIYAQSNVILPNNYFLYGRDSGATPRALIGVNTANSCLVGSGVTGTTDIYAGGANVINLHSTTVALSQLNVNGYLYMQGGARCYIPGGNDPLQIYADNGYYARNHYVIGGLRDWSQGALSNGQWALADETAHVVRLQCDFNGLFTFTNSVTVLGNLNVSGSTNIGNVVMGAATINNGLNVYNGLAVQSGGLGVNGNAQFNNLVTMGSGLNVSGTINTAALNCTALGCTGSAQINGGLTLFNGLNVASGNGSFAGTLTVGGNGQFNSSLGVSGNCSIGGTYFGAALQMSGTVYGGGTATFGALAVSGQATLSSNLSVGGTATMGAFSSGTGYVGAGGLHTNGTLTADGSSNLNGYTHVGFLQVGGLNWIYDNGGNVCVFQSGLQCTYDFFTNGNAHISGDAYINNSMYSYYAQIGNHGIQSSGNIWMVANGGGGNEIVMQPVYANPQRGRFWSMRVDADWIWFNDAYGYPPSAAYGSSYFVIMAGGIQVLSGGNGYKQGGGLWADNSERRVKKEIEDYKSGLAVVRKLRPRTYKFNGLAGTIENDRRYTGLIYDEVEDLMPELLGTLEQHAHGRPGKYDGGFETVKTIDATPVIYALINSVKELAAQIDDLKRRRAA